SAKPQHLLLAPPLHRGQASPACRRRSCGRCGHRFGPGEPTSLGCCARPASQAITPPPSSMTAILKLNGGCELDSEGFHPVPVFAPARGSAFIPAVRILNFIRSTL